MPIPGLDAGIKAWTEKAGSCRHTEGCWERARDFDTCSWLGDDIHLHKEFIFSVLIKHVWCARCSHCTKAMRLLGSSLHLQGWREGWGWSQELLNLVISGNCLTKSSLHSKENPGVGLGVPTDLSQVKITPYFCFMNLTSLGIILLKTLLQKGQSRLQQSKNKSSNPSVDKFLAVSPKYPSATVMSPRVKSQRSAPDFLIALVILSISCSPQMKFFMFLTNPFI